MSHVSMQRGLGLILDLATSPNAYASAAAAASAAVLYRRPARCEYLNPSHVDSGDVFYIPRAPLGSSSAAGLGFGEPLHGLNYAPQRHHQLKTVSSVFSPGNLLFTALRSLLFNLLPVWHDYFQRVEAAEEEAFAKGLEPLEAWPPFPREQVPPALWRSLWLGLRDLATLTIRRVYEREVAIRCSVSTCVKLLKDARASANRKAYLPFYQRLYRIPITYFRANILGAAADCTVSLAVDTYRVIYVPARQGRVEMTQKRALQRFSRLIVANGFRCSTCLLVASAGAGVGAWLLTIINRPGTGSFIGASAAEFGFTVFVVAPLVNDWAYGPHDGQPPPRIEGAAGGDGCGSDVQLPGSD